MSELVLVINPGSTSTKLALFEGGVSVGSRTVQHRPEELGRFPNVMAQADYRMEAIRAFMEDMERRFVELAAVAGRGGVVRPTRGGTYVVTDELIADLHRGAPWEHASNLGGVLSRAIADKLDIPAFIVDPVAVDELAPICRISGHPSFPNTALQHTLNIKATVRRAACDFGMTWDSISAIVVHLGGGISVCAHIGGKMIEAYNANERGPMSPERAGSLPSLPLVRMAYSGQWSYQELRRYVAGKGGMMSYIGTSDLREAEGRASAGDTKAAVVLEAMAMQICAAIGACSVMPKGRLNVIALTGGGANSSMLVDMIIRHVSWIAPVAVYPGESEMQALCDGTMRVLRGQESALDYGQQVKEHDELLKNICP